MKQVLAYCRTSTNKQDKGLESQVRAIKEYCKYHKIKCSQIYKDAGVSGMKNKRPQLDALLSKIESGEVSTVIVYSFSRFARSTTFLLNMVDSFKKLNIRFISITEQIDTSTPHGRVFMGLISLLNQMEREVTSERIKNGLRNAKANGKIIGREKSRNSKLIKELRKNSYTYKEIAKLTKCSISTVSRELTGYFHKKKT